MSEQAVAYEPAKQRPWRWFGNEVVRPVLRSPAAWVYAVFWVTTARRKPWLWVTVDRNGANVQQLRF